MGLGGVSHWIIILVIVLLIFGVGRISNVMGELGKGIKSFKEGLNDEDDDKRKREERRHLPPQSRAPEQPIDVTPEPRAETRVPPADETPRG